MFELKLEKNPGRGPCIEMYGEWVTPEVHEVVTRMMQDNRISSPVYQARMDANVFFQGGYDRPHDHWILLEFWEQEHKCQEFIRLLSIGIDRVIAPVLTRIRVNLYDYHQAGSLTLCCMIAEETGCPYNSGGWNEPFTFYPEDNIMYRKVMGLIKTFELITC